MSRGSITIREAAKKWVQGFHTIPQGIIKKLMQLDCEDWREVTKPACGNRVYVSSAVLSDSFEDEECAGTILGYDKESNFYCIELDDGFNVSLKENDFEAVRYGRLPMWGTMWSFSDTTDDYWLEKMDGIRAMSHCGFRIYESREFGHFFGIDSAGYDFWEKHWIPLYQARGLQWHDLAAEGGAQHEGI